MKDFPGQEGAGTGTEGKTQVGWAESPSFSGCRGLSAGDLPTAQQGIPNSLVEIPFLGEAVTVIK